VCPGDEKRKKRSEPQAMGSVLEGVLKTLDIDLAAPSAEIGRDWEQIVGGEVARHCRPIGMKAGVLHVEVDSSVWCQELQLRSPETMTALRKRLGKSAPTDLRLRVGYSRSQDPGGEGRDSETRFEGSSQAKPHRR
jgi:predicted nucleic acid-binding Zn ribbon protein